MLCLTAAAVFKRPKPAVLTTDHCKSQLDKVVSPRLSFTGIGTSMQINQLSCQVDQVKALTALFPADDSRFSWQTSDYTTWLVAAISTLEPQGTPDTHLLLLDRQQQQQQQQQ